MEARIMNRALAKATVAAPSQAEVERAIRDLQISNNWIHRVLNLIDYPTALSVLSSSGQSRVCDVFLLLRKESILRMVVSVATDKAVWNAVMANKEVSDLLNSFSRFAAIGEEKAKGNDEKRDWRMLLMEWVLGIGNSMIQDFMARLNSFLDKASKTSNKNQQQHASSSPEEFNSTLKATYFLSCVVFLIVVVARANVF